MDYTFGPKFDALRNAIYHTARRNFFDLMNRGLNFLVIILGASVAGKATHLFDIRELWLELSVLVAATAQLTFDFGYRARTHEFLQRKYYDMLAELELEATPDPQKWASKLFTIAGDEPMPLRALDALAYNAALDATSSNPAIRTQYRLHVPWYQRMLRHVIAFHSYAYWPEREYVSWWSKKKPARNPEGGKPNDGKGKIQEGHEGQKGQEKRS
jgi:hypothetical protein